MTKIFLYLANRSITTGFLILAVIGLRFLFRKLPKGPQLLLWAAVALRLAVPLSLESSWSLIPSAEPIPTQTTAEISIQQDSPSDRTGNTVIPTTTSETLDTVTSAAATTASLAQPGSTASPVASTTTAVSTPPCAYRPFPGLHRRLASGYGGHARL